MNYKQIRFGEDARTEMVKGINIVADAVKATMGPNGRNVVIKRKFTAPHITKDGVTVAREIRLRDEFKDMGAQLVLEASSRANEESGDGSTQTAVLTQSIVNNGMRYLEKGVAAIELKRGLDIACEHAVAFIKGCAIPVSDQTLISIAKISANSDSAISKLISDAVDAVGGDGIITVEKGGLKDELELITGMRIDSGWLNQQFLGDSGKLIIELDNPKVVLIDKKLADPNELIRICEQLVQDKKCAMIIAHEFSEAVIGFLVNNFKRGVFNIIPVVAPAFGERRTGILEDLAIYTAGTVFNSSNGEEIASASVRVLGECEKISISREETAFIGGFGKANKITDRVAKIKSLMESETSQYNIDKYKERLGSLSKGVAVIKVGGHTEVEMKEKKDRVDDAICAVRAALQEGIIPGAGMTLVWCEEHLNRGLKELVLSDDQMIGYKIFLQSISAPFQQILLNAGLTPEVIRANITRQFEETQNQVVFNLNTRKLELITETQVLDPAKVTRTALQNAVSIAGLVLTTEVMIGWDGEDTSSNLGMFADQ